MAMGLTTTVEYLQFKLYISEKSSHYWSIMAGFRAPWREGEIRSRWVKVFDPATARVDSEALVRELRKDCDGDGFRDSREGRALIIDIQQQLKTIPNYGRLIPIAVMVGGHEFGADVYRALSELTPVKSGLLLLGYSAGYTKSYEGYPFSDGTSMNKRIFLPKQDLGVLLRNRAAPILLIDHMLGTGSNTVAIRNKLRDMGMTGDVYLIHTSIWTGKVTVDEVERVDTARFRYGVVWKHLKREYILNKKKLPTTIFNVATFVAYNVSLFVTRNQTVSWSLFAAMQTSGLYNTYMNWNELIRDIKRLPKLKSNKKIPDIVTETNPGLRS